MSEHARLSASSSHIWLNCPPSVALSEGIADAGSPYAKQGTDAHALCEYKLLKALGRDAEDPTENLEFFDAEMDACTDEYRNFVMEQVENAREYCLDPEVLVEQRLDFHNWVEQGFGTGDCVIVADSELHIIDFKYGLGVLVDAERNPQLMCYSLGALDIFDALYDIQTIRMTIFQPRRDHVSSFTIGRDDLLDWAENVLKPAAALAYKGEGEFKAGSHCTFCRAKATCRKRAEHNLELAKYDFAMPDTLETSEIAAILPRIDDLVSWGNDIKEYALKEALNGTEFKGYKIVEGRAVRKYTNEDAVASAVTDAGYDPYDRKVKGITAMTSMLGKPLFEDILSGLIEKPAGRPTLVPVSDKRPAINSAKDDFE